MNRRRFLATLAGAVIARHLPKPAPVSPGEALFFLDPEEFTFKGGAQMRVPIQYTVSTDAIFLKLAANLYIDAPRASHIVVGFKSGVS